MPLACMKHILPQYVGTDRALGCFTVHTMEMVMGAVKAAEELGLPIAIQIAEARLPQAPLHLLGPVMLEAARRASVPVCVHLDHGLRVETVEEAVRLGFTSVMFDGSRADYAANIESTRRAGDRARGINPDVLVEGELGVVGGSENGETALAIQCTDPAMAVEYCTRAAIDALAVAIGNAHGPYPQAPELRCDVVQDIRRRTNVPLVLHGGSGISDSEFRRVIESGIDKVNIATALFTSVAEALAALLANQTVSDYRPLGQAIADATSRQVARHLRLFHNLT